MYRYIRNNINNKGDYVRNRQRRSNLWSDKNSKICKHIAIKFTIAQSEFSFYLEYCATVTNKYTKPKCPEPYERPLIQLLLKILRGIFPYLSIRANVSRRFLTVRFGRVFVSNNILIDEKVFSHSPKNTRCVQPILKNVYPGFNRSWNSLETWSNLCSFDIVRTGVQNSHLYLFYNSEHCLLAVECERAR